MADQIPVGTQCDVRTSVWASLLNAGHSPEFIAALVQPEHRDRVFTEFTQEKE